jgi:hypothetical protein
MYDNTPPPLGGPACLSRFAFLSLGLITLAWIVYSSLTPPDPSLGAFGPLFYRLTHIGLGLAWIIGLAGSGLLWVIAQLTSRRD